MALKYTEEGKKGPGETDFLNCYTNTSAVYAYIVKSDIGRDVIPCIEELPAEYRIFVSVRLVIRDLYYKVCGRFSEMYLSANVLCNT